MDALQQIAVSLIGTATEVVRVKPLSTARDPKPKWARGCFWQTVGHSAVGPVQTLVNPRRTYQPNGKREVARRLRKAA